MKNERYKALLFGRNVRIANSTVYVILPWELYVTSNRVISLAHGKAACKLNVFQFENIVSGVVSAPGEIPLALKFPAV